MPSILQNSSLFRVCFASLLTVASANAAGVLVASYSFNNSLAANQAGVPSIVSVDPLGLNAFETAIVNGASQRVFHWQGNANPATQQAGLTLNATGLVQYENYSVELTFEFLQNAQAGGGWRRIVDTQNRQSDNGFYVDPGNHLQVYPVITGSTLFTTPGFHDVILTNFVNGGTREVKAYLDGVLELTSNTDQLNLDNVNNPNHLLSFFLDNVAGPAQNEFANGRIASLSVFDGIITPVTATPEPATISLISAALLLCAVRFLATRTPIQRPSHELLAPDQGAAQETR